MWFSKEQNLVMTSTFGLELIATKTAMEMVQAIYISNAGLNY
jgi:hypothetical protein